MKASGRSRERLRTADKREVDPSISCRICRGRTNVERWVTAVHVRHRSKSGPQNRVTRLSVEDLDSRVLYGLVRIGRMQMRRQQ
jgi:hypothetical protein